jgi:hypothetical protein
VAGRESPGHGSSQDGLLVRRISLIVAPGLVALGLGLVQRRRRNNWRLGPSAGGSQRAFQELSEARDALMKAL